MAYGLRDHLTFFILFSGHNVVACEYDTDTTEFEIRDPASAKYHKFQPLLRKHEYHLKYRAMKTAGLPLTCHSVDVCLSIYCYMLIAFIILLVP